MLPDQWASPGPAPLAIIIRPTITAATAVAARIVKNQYSRLPWSKKSFAFLAGQTRSLCGGRGSTAAVKRTQPASIRRPAHPPLGRNPGPDRLELAALEHAGSTVQDKHDQRQDHQFSQADHDDATDSPGRICPRRSAADLPAYRMRPDTAEFLAWIGGIALRQRQSLTLRIKAPVPLQLV